MNEPYPTSTDNLLEIPETELESNALPLRQWLESRRCCLFVNIKWDFGVTRGEILLIPEPAVWPDRSMMYLKSSGLAFGSHCCY